MRLAEETGNVEIQIPHSKQKKLVQELNPNLFNEIWTHDKIWNKDSDTLDVVNLKFDGKYIQFLEAFGKENLKVKNYVNSFKKVGSISPSMFADILINYEEYDVRDERIQLLVAIHYLTLNEEYKIQRKLSSSSYSVE